MKERKGRRRGGLSPQQFFEQEVKPRLNPRVVYANLDLKQVGAGWRGPCPFHKGEDPNFSVNMKTGAWRCFSQCGAGGDMLQFIAGTTEKLRRRAFTKAVEKAAAIAGVALPAGWITDSARPEARRLRASYRAARDAHLQWVQHQHADARIVAEYVYHNLDGSVWAKRTRIEWPDGKRFGWFHETPAGWEWKRPKGLAPFKNLHELDFNRPVFITEGEKACDRARAIGLNATCAPDGAGGATKCDIGPLLGAHEIRCLPDNDDKGRRFAGGLVARFRQEAGFAGRVAFVTLEGLPNKGDAYDYIEARTQAGLTDTEILAEIEARAPADALDDIDVPEGLDDEQRPEVVVDTDEHRVISEAVAALARDPGLYVRDGQLVRVTQTDGEVNGVTRPSGANVIGLVPAANLRERLTKHAKFRKANDSGLVPCHPSAWIVHGVIARGEWEPLRQLRGVSDAPVLRPDGTVWQKPGYDRESRVLYTPAERFPAISASLNRDDAVAAAHDLLEIVQDFPFKCPSHRSAWLAGLLTPLARFAFDGPCPLFLLDANAAGAGKTLLARVMGRVVLGREIPVSSFTRDSDELRKRITTLAIAGDRMVLFDNLDGLFGNVTLDRALTSTYWQDRLLGTNQQVSLPLLPAWYATGNNVQIAADTARRIVPIRLEVMAERPEARSGFVHDNLIRHVSAHRAALLVKSLTILAAYCREGLPPQDLPAFGAFEGWSAIVRSAIVWAGQPDPCAARDYISTCADCTRDDLGMLLDAFEAYDPEGSGIVIADALRVLYGPGAPTDDPSHTMRAALEHLVHAPAGKPPTARQVGNCLKRFRQRVAGGRYLDTVPGPTRRAGATWRVVRVCDSSESVSALNGFYRDEVRKERKVSGGETDSPDSQSHTPAALTATMNGGGT